MKTFRTLSALLLALLVLVSSTTFAVGMHFCRGEIQNVSLFTKAEGCKKEKSLPPCHRHTTAPCCEDETVLHNGEDFKASFNDIQIATLFQLELSQAFLFIADVVPAAPVTHTPFTSYDPPLRSCDRTIVLSVFII